MSAVTGVVAVNSVPPVSSGTVYQPLKLPSDLLGAAGSVPTVVAGEVTVMVAGFAGVSPPFSSKVTIKVPAALAVHRAYTVMLPVTVVVAKNCVPPVSA
jgi:hypothetical protein